MTMHDLYNNTKEFYDGPSNDFEAPEPANWLKTSSAIIDDLRNFTNKFKWRLFFKDRMEDMRRLRVRGVPLLPL